MSILNTIKEKLTKGESVVVRFFDMEKSYIEEFDDNMVAEITALELELDEEDQEVIGYKIFLNWAKFTEHNNKIDKGRFYDRDGNPTLKYSESPYYPKNHITDFYIDDNEAQSHMVLVYPEDIKAFENVPKPQASKEDLLALLKEHLKLNVKVKGDREGGYQTVSVDITVLFAGETICGSRDYTSFCVNNN